MLRIFGIHTRRESPVKDARIITELNGDVRIGDLIAINGGCPRFPGDTCDLVGGYKSVVIEYRGSLYYKIVA